MNETKYYITLNNKTVAECVNLDDGLLFIKALIEKYYNEHTAVYAICEMPHVEVEEQKLCLIRRKRNEEIIY